MKKAKRTAKSPAKNKPAASTKKASRPAAKKVDTARRVTTSTKPAAGTWTPGQIQGIGWKPFRYPPE
jgi:hypothetical protein